MGMGQDADTQSAFHNFLKSNKFPLIIDALYFAAFSDEVCSIDIFEGYIIFFVANQVGNFSFAFVFASIWFKMQKQCIY